MAEGVPKRFPDPTQAQEIAAAAEEAIEEIITKAASSPTFLDLSTVPTWSRNVVEPRITISYKSNIGLSSIRGASEIKSAAKALPNVPSPTPASLIIHQDENESTTLYGIPTTARSDSFLALEWVDQNREVRANFLGILRAKGIEIPQGTKMVIKLKHIEHPAHGHCVKLSWAGDCFVPIHELGEREDEEPTP